MVAVADNAAVYATVKPFDAAFWRRFIVMALGLLVVFWLGEMLLSGRESSGGHSGERRMWIWRTVSAVWHRCGVVARGAMLSVAMLLCWTPYVVLLYPGLMWYDTGDEIAQIFGIPALGQPAGVISAHHPVFDTLVFGGFAKTTAAWFGDYQLGLSILVIAQVVLMCVALSACVLYVRKVGASRLASVLLFLFFALFPALPIFFMSLVKDSLHAVFAVPWLLMYVETCRTRLESLRSPRFLCGFALLSLGSALTTMTGAYITALSLLGLVFARKRGDYDGSMAALRAIAAALGVTVLLVVQVVFPAVAGSFLNIKKEDANQLLVVPMQMTARYVSDHPDDISVEERSVIDSLNKVPTAQMPQMYNPYLADNVIHLSLRDSSYIGRYGKVWLAQGVRHPGSYVNGFAALESGWFSLKRTPSNEMGPTGVERYADMAHDAIANQIVLRTANDISPSFAEIPEYRANTAGQDVAARIWDKMSNMPVVKWTTYTAVWSFVLPLFLLFCALRRRGAPRTRHGVAYKLLVGVPLIWSLLSLLPNAISIPLKPTASRYVMWAIYTIPVYIALLHAERVGRGRDDGNEQ